MSNAYCFETLTARREQILQWTETLNDDLQFLVELLDASIEAEEEHVGISDPSHKNYPATARTHKARRNNLMKLILRAKQPRVLH
jgi:hypothetical protein